MNKPIIIITVSAWRKMKHILQRKNNSIGFLFSADGGGCNGFKYKLNPIDQKQYACMHLTVYNSANVKFTF